MIRIQMAAEDVREVHGFHTKNFRNCSTDLGEGESRCQRERWVSTVDSPLHHQVRPISFLPRDTCSLALRPAGGQASFAIGRLFLPALVPRPCFPHR